MKPALIVNEIPRGIGVDEAKNDQSSVQVSKSGQVQRPVAPPRKNVKMKSQEVEKPIPGNFFQCLFMSGIARAD